MNDRLKEVYTHSTEHHQKYTYFLLAIAASAIALCVQQTAEDILRWSLLPLGFAVIAWALSFLCGVRFLQYRGAILYSNYDLIRVQTGQHPEVDNTIGGYKEAAESVIRLAIDSNNQRASNWGKWQFRLIVIGAVFFLSWHLTEMAVRTSNHISTEQTATDAQCSSVGSILSCSSCASFRLHLKLCQGYTEPLSSTLAHKGT